MVYVIKEINEDAFLLPNISLGFQIFDSCAHISRAVWETLTCLTGVDRSTLNYQCTRKVPLAIIGDSVSLLSIAMATILGVYRYPQVSYAASVISLSNRVLYPSFFRTAPSDDKQTRAFAKLVLYMGWTWVGLLSLNNDYGIQGSQILKEELQKMGVCIAYHETFGQGTSFKKIQSIANIIVQSSAKVVILFSRDPHINQLMELVLERKDVKRIWLASIGWSNSPMLSIPRYSQTLVGTIGFSLYEVDMPGFEEFLMDIHPSTSLPEDIFFKTFWEKIFGCRWLNAGAGGGNESVWCTGEEKLKGLTNIKYDFRYQYLIYNAVYAVANALHNLMFSCTFHPETIISGKCVDIPDIKPWQIFHQLKSVFFKNRMGEEVYFDSNGNPPTDYDVLNWQGNSDGTIKFVKVGRYKLRKSIENELNINMTAIRWITGGQEIPRSVCSDSCSPGFRKAAQKGQPMCCFDCVPCADGEVSSQIDSSNCVPCTPETWPNKNQTECIPKTVEFLSYWEPLGITLTSTAVFCSFTTLSILCVFVKYKDTAIVKANNSDLTYVLLVFLCLSFLCSLLFIGEPKKFTCLFRQGAFGVIFVLCVSCIFAKTLMVIIAFRATKPGSDMRKWLGPKVPALNVSICTFIQLFISTFWILFCPPFPENNIKIMPGFIIFQCNECSDILLWCMLGYMAFLACVSFFVAFLARNLPDSFNEAKWITFSMLIFLSVWISFVPAYLSTQGKLMVAVEVFGIILSSAGILSCFFFPKCYIILLRPDLNTREHMLGRGNTQKTNI
ncbi:extracellular calcium-sensing receptor-like [Mixophyes fleayi]|uniref:extracellular calcium-sensing receptor-like n=1 Tax=Mixophyes fleayi TaxID=3061075 RepID=UPI003F4DFF04